MHPRVPVACEGHPGAHGGGRIMRRDLHDYPFLERDDLRAALGFAAEQLDHDALHR